eukprot:scaffold64_cov161-Prasinococcus_capsulatus_cf.AAC.1
MATAAAAAATFPVVVQRPNLSTLGSRSQMRRRPPRCGPIRWQASMRRYRTVRRISNSKQPSTATTPTKN